MDHYPLSGENVFPEGITEGPGSTFFVGSLGTGAIYAGDVSAVPAARAGGQSRADVA